MDTRELLMDAYDRVTQLYGEVAEGLGEQALNQRPDGHGNPIGWLLWHVARVEDQQVAGVFGRPQVWEQWQERVGLPHGSDDIGFGHTSDQVDAVRFTDTGALVDYQRAVAEAVTGCLQTLDGADLDRVVDPSYDPPVSAGVRLVSVQGDLMQHLGQAAYLKGLLTGWKYPA